MSGGFEPWHTTTGGGSGTGDVVGPSSATSGHLATFSGTTGKLIADGGAAPTGTNTGDVTLGAVAGSPNSAGAVLTGQALTLSLADGSHPGLIGGTSAAQTLAPAFTLSSTLTLSASLVAGGVYDYRTAGGTLITTANGAYGTYHLIRGGNATAIDLITSGSGTGETISFPSSVCMPFPVTLSPAGTTQTVDWTKGSSQTIDAASTTGTLVLTFSFMNNGGRYILKTLGKTGRAWTMPASLWAGGVKPTVTAVDGAIDVFQFIYDGTNLIGSIIAQNVS